MGRHGIGCLRDGEVGVVVSGGVECVGCEPVILERDVGA